MPDIDQKSELFEEAMALPEGQREALAYELLETLSDEASGISVDDPDFETELKRRSGDWNGAIPAEEVWSTPHE